MSDFTDKVLDQYELGLESIDKLITAGKGLAIRIRDESSKQFNELIDAGKELEDSDKGILEQVKESLEEQLGDVKGTAHKARLASLGLLSQVKDNSEKFFNDLVTLGETEKEESETKAV